MSMCVDALLAMGMQVRVQCLQAAAYGVPQQRIRYADLG
jgi:site-specific DNA-cytosine methylase